MARILHALALIALVAVLAIGCSDTSDLSSDELAVRATIERYNELLTEGYRALDMNPLGEAASSQQAEDEYIHMSSLAEGGIRLDPTLTGIEFLSVSVESTSAQVETRETWDYRHYARDSGELVLEQVGLVYHLAWDLERKPTGTWLVSDVRAISATSTVEPTILGTDTPSPPAGH